MLRRSASKHALFGGRLILAHSERLYPHHKWFLRVLDQVPDKPAGLVAKIEALTTRPKRELAEQFYEMINGFQAWHAPADWPAQFMLHSELNWMSGPSPLDDI